MMTFTYKLRSIKSTTKPLDVYSMNEKFCEFKGYYKNVWTRVLDYILRKYSLIDYILKDIEGNKKMVIEDKTGLGKRKVQATYFPRDNDAIPITIEDKNPFKTGENAEFCYQGETFYIKRKPFKPAEMIVNDNIIAEYKIDPVKRIINITIKDSDYYDKEFFVLGTFHAYLYAMD